MTLLTWNDSYSVGVLEIDCQHTVLFDILNELHAAMLAGEASSLTGPILCKLVTYTREHFAAEEAMLEQSKYPGIEPHKQLHRDLIKQVQEYADRFEKGEITLNLHLLNFLRDWLANHILKVDHAYGPWLIEHGAK